MLARDAGATTHSSGHGAQGLRRAPPRLGQQSRWGDSPDRLSLVTIGLLPPARVCP